MLIVSRPPVIWSMVANWRANCGAHISPIRTATNNWMRRVSVAMAEAKATESMPIAYPEGSSRLSKPPSSARNAIPRQCSQLDRSAVSATPRNS